MLQQIAWWLFAAAPLRFSSLLAGASALSAAYLVVRSVFFLHWLLHHSKAELRNGVSRCRFQTVGFFLGAFLSIAFLLTFAVAFDDRAAGGHSLFYNKDAYLAAPLTSAAAPAPTGALLYFDLDRASLDVLAGPSVDGKIPAPYKLLHENGGSCKGNTSPAARSNCNATGFRELAKFLTAVRPTSRLRITLMAHADPVAGSERVNWDLTRIRASEVRRQLMAWLGEEKYWEEDIAPQTKPDAAAPAVRKGFHNVEFVEIPVGSQTMFLYPVHGSTLRAKNPEEWRLVEVKLEAIAGDPSELSQDAVQGGAKTLLDYAYFMIYTITTTGYGDVVPVTAFVKFITSIANIIEVLFLVIFINAIISIAPQLRPDDSSTETRKPQGDTLGSG